MASVSLTGVYHRGPDGEVREDDHDHGERDDRAADQQPAVAAGLLKTHTRKP